MVTGDLGRASAVLPLDIGVSLRGVTPLAVVSALTAGSATRRLHPQCQGTGKAGSGGYSGLYSRKFPGLDYPRAAGELGHPF
jgi:hypothetical protein